MTSVATLSWFPFEQETIRKIDKVERVERGPQLKSLVLGLILPLNLGNAFRWLSLRIAEFIVSRLDAKSERFASSAIWFEGARSGILEQIVVTAEFPSNDLLVHISAFEKSNNSLVRLCQENIIKLRDLNPSSRLASAFERMEQAATRLGLSIDGIKTIVIETKQGSEFLLKSKQARDSFLHSRSMITNNGNEDLDDEFLALAEEAVNASDARSSANDPDWARRLVSSPLQ